MDGGKGIGSHCGCDSGRDEGAKVERVILGRRGGDRNCCQMPMQVGKRGGHYFIRELITRTFLRGTSKVGVIGRGSFGPAGGATRGLR